MTRGNGTGRTGRGPDRGRGISQGGRDRMGGPFVAGHGESCVCPNCGHKVAHVVGQPCNAMNCPKCGTRMTRQ